MQLVDHEERSERDTHQIGNLRQLCEDAVLGAHQLYGEKMGTSKVHRLRHFYEDAGRPGLQNFTGDAVRFPGLLACSAWKGEQLHKRSRAAFNRVWRAMRSQDFGQGDGGELEQHELAADRGARVMQKATALNYL